MKGTEHYPLLMTVTEVAEILKVSKRVAYEIMDSENFPLIKIRRSKRVNKYDFFEWLDNQVQNKEKKRDGKF